jgi:hypothetical protein
MCIQEEKRVHQSRPPAREGGLVKEGASFHMGENKSLEQNTLFVHQSKLNSKRI